MGQQDSGFGAGAVLLSFFVGGIIGAGVALLTAPKTGQETRKMIRDFATMRGIKRENISVRSRTGLLITWTREKSFGQPENIISRAVEAGKEAYDKERHG